MAIYRGKDKKSLPCYPIRLLMMEIIFNWTQQLSAIPRKIKNNKMIIADELFDTSDKSVEIIRILHFTMRNWEVFNLYCTLRN